MHNLNKCICKGKGNISECKDIIKYTKSNVMDEYAHHVYKELIDPLKKLKDGSKNPNVSFISTVLGKEGEVNEDLKSIYNNYANKRKMWRGNSPKLNEVDEETVNRIKSIGKLNSSDVSKTLRSVKAKLSFDFKFMFEDYLLEPLNDMESKTGTMALDENGDYKWNGLRYSIDNNIEKVVDIVSDKKIYADKKVKEGEMIKLRVNNLTYADLIEDKISIKGIDVSVNGTKLGELFKEIAVEDGEFEFYLYHYETKDNKEYKKAKTMSVYVMA